MRISRRTIHKSGLSARDQELVAALLAADLASNLRVRQLVNEICDGRARRGLYDPILKD